MPVPSRDESIAALSEREFDVLVIGGGITGAGIARDAALRGLSVALVEKDDFASGTSSRSSRLVHGGVRYLEHGYVRLVFESSAERRRLLGLAPHLVRPLPFLWPVYADARIRRWKLAAGLTLYDLLAFFRNVEPHRMLSRVAVLEVEPALRAETLVGGARYFDAGTDDTRLTLANVLDAVDRGTVAANHAAVRALRITDGMIRGAVVEDCESGMSATVRARCVVNAAGPWSDSIRILERPTGTRAVHGSKGVHVSVPRDRIGNRGAVTILSPRDGRVMFVLPAAHHTIIGTTDTFTSESPDEVRATQDDVSYLLESANALFPEARLTGDDVIAAWAGIRPLIATQDESSLVTTREHAISISPAGLISISGGKLTTYRIMAAQAVDVVARRLGRPRTKSITALRPLHGGDLDVPAAERRALATIGVEPLAKHLVRAYGSLWEDVWKEIRHTGGDTRLGASLPYTVGELRYAARHEMARTVADVLIRRTHLAYETRDNGRSVAAIAAGAIGGVLGWGGDRVRDEIEKYGRDVERIFRVEPRASTT